MKKFALFLMAFAAIVSCTSKGGKQAAAGAHADSMKVDSANVITDSLTYVRQSILDAQAAIYPEFNLISMSIRQDSGVYKGDFKFTFLRNQQVIYTEQEFETDERGIISKLRKKKYALYKDLKEN
jgi:hypothetical protein